MSISVTTGFDSLDEGTSNFLTMDVAQKKDGNWIIMELGDGQVSGLPDNADKVFFIKR